MFIVADLVSLNTIDYVHTIIQKTQNIKKLSNFALFSIFFSFPMIVSLEFIYTGL